MTNNIKTKPAYDIVIVVSSTLLGLIFSFGYSNFNPMDISLCALIIYISAYFSFYVYYLSDDMIIKHYLERPIYSIKKAPMSNLDYIEIRRKDVLKQLPLVVFWRKDRVQTSNKFLINSYFFSK